MASTPIAIGQQTAAHFIAADKQRERWFFNGMAIAMAVSCFVGFAPSYYLRGPLQAPGELSLMLHVHGAVFTLWIVLLVTQTSFVAAGRTDIHRRLGIAGTLLAVAMVVLGAVVAITRAQQGLLGQGSGAPPLVFLAIPLTALVAFTALVGAAIYFRRRPDTHKRLMLLATVEILGAAFGRIPALASAGPPAFFAVTDLFILAMMIFDFATRGRAHRATLWGGGIVVGSQVLTLVIAPTQAWLAFATWLTGG